MRRALPLVLSLAAALPLPVNAAEPPATRRPWPRGTLMPSLALGASVLVDRPGGTLQLSGGLSYFVVDHLALGLSLRSSTSFLVEYVRTYHPGVEKQIATHEFSVTPVVTVVPHRGYLISPFIGVGVGPVILNHQHGVLGEFVVTPGVLLKLAKQVALTMAIEIAARFPGDRKRDAYRYDDPLNDYTTYFDSRINVAFQAGVAFAIGVGRARRAASAPAPAARPAPSPPASATDRAPPPAPVEPARPPAQPIAPELLPAANTASLTPHRPEPRDGRRLAIAGVVLLGASIPLTLVGVRLMFSDGPDGEPSARPTIGLTMASFGVAAALVGIPVASVGAHRRRLWLAWERQRGLSLRPNLRHQPGGATLGLTLRF